MPTVRPTVRVWADQSYGFAIVGESFYQPAIADAIGGWPHTHNIDRIRQEFTGFVAVEPTNPVDEHAIRVTGPAGLTLGHFPHAETARYGAVLADCDLEVSAVVFARWIGTRWNGGVWLDLPTPEEILGAIRDHYS